MKQEKDERQWHDQFEKLKLYKEENNHCRVPHRYKKDQSLAQWVSTQRSLYHQGRLLPEKLTELDSIQFEWRISMRPQHNTSKEDDLWLIHYNDLVEFQKEHEHCNVPRL